MTCGCRLPHAETVCSSVPKIIINNYGIFKKKIVILCFQNYDELNFF